MKFNLLWIDDEIEMMSPYVFDLRQSGYDVQEIGSLQDAIQKLANPGHVDLAIVDLDLHQQSYDLPPDYFPYAGAKLANDLTAKTKCALVILSSYLDQISVEIDARHGLALVDKGKLSVPNLYKAIERAHAKSKKK